MTSQSNNVTRRWLVLGVALVALACVMQAGRAADRRSDGARVRLAAVPSAAMQSQPTQSQPTQSQPTQSQMAQSRVAQSRVAQWQVAQSQAAQSQPARSPAARSQASHWPGWPPTDIKRGEPAARGPASSLALEAVQTAVAVCSKNGFKAAALVVDSAGEPVAMFRADGAPRIDLASATRKAFVVIYTKKPSADAAARVKSDPAFARELVATGKALPVRGGLPIKVGGEVIGAIAVGGAPPPGEQDEVCSRAGLDRIASRLR